MKSLKDESIEYSERHQDVSGVLGKYLVSAVFQDGANSNWVKAEKIKAKIELLEDLNINWDLEIHPGKEDFLIELNYLKKQLKELEK